MMMKEMETAMKYQHVIWDWNGTLLDDSLASAQALDRMMRNRNLGSVTLEEYRNRITYPVIQLYYEAGFDFVNESYEDMCEEYIRYYKENAATVALHEDAVGLLSWLRDRGVRQHIVSASEYGILVAQIAHYGIRDYFDTISGQKNNRGDSKEHLARELMASLCADPDKVLVIGDTIHDFEVANHIGAHCFFVTNGHCSEARLLATGAPVFPSLDAIRQALEQEA